MRSLALPSIPIPVSRLVMGMSAPPRDLPSLFDRFVESGGNAFDSARWYDEEPLLGAWLAGRTDRDQLVVVGKCCHPLTQDGPPRVTPEAIVRDVEESLLRLRTDRIDLLLLHRDDPAVPAGELIGALAEIRAAGLVRAYGASNWTVERLEAAAEWAARQGLPPFTVSSPNLSLASPVRPPWPGCVSAGDERSLAWYVRRQMPLMAWSPLARGYLADEGTRANAEVRRSFDSPQNRARRAVAARLARERGVSLAHVALAWVLCQPFPTFAVVGARSPAEVEVCASAVELALDPSEMEALAAATGSGCPTMVAREERRGRGGRCP